MKRLFKTCLAILPAFGLLAACSSSAAKPVDPESVDNPLIKSVAELSSESDSQTVQEVFGNLIQQTAEDNDYAFQILQTRSQDQLSFENDETTVKNTTGKTYDIRMTDMKNFYELNEDSDGTNATFGLIRQGTEGISQVIGSMKDADLEKEAFDVTVTDFYSETDDDLYTDEEAKTISQNSLVYPLFALMGGTLTLQPVYYPELYDFTTTVSGDTYTLTVSIKDPDEYNKQLEDFYKNQYGFERNDFYGDGSLVFDNVKSKSLSLTLTLSSTGAIEKIESASDDVFTLDKKDFDVKGSAVSEIKAADESMKDKLETLIAGIIKDDPKAGDTLKINLGDGEAEDEKADAAKDDVKDDSKDDAKDDSKDAEKSDSKADEKTDSKSDKSETSKTDDSKSDDKKEQSK